VRAGVGRTFQVGGGERSRAMTVLEKRDHRCVSSAPRTDDEAERLAYAALQGRVRPWRTIRRQMLAGGLTTKAASPDGALRARRLAPKPKLLLARRDARRPWPERTRRHPADHPAGQTARGVTIVIIEHTMHAMVKLADHFSGARSRAAESPRARRAEVVKNPAVIEAYLRQEVDETVLKIRVA